MKNKRLILMIISIFMLLMIIFGASYSYFAAQGVGSGDDRQVTTTVGELKLTYADGSEYLTTNGDWEPGDYLVKTFTVTNNSSSTAYYRIYMDDVVNTFVMQKKDENGNIVEDAPYELIYILKKNDEIVISEESNTPVLNAAGIIYGNDGLGIEIEKNSTDTYELAIKFIDTNENQNYNQSKLFKASIALKIKTSYEKFQDMMATRTDMAIDDYDNIRFVGKDANNFISFNDEEWRIIGIMKNVEILNEDGTTSKHDLIKIIRNKSIGNYQWDNKGQYGENDWSESSLKNLLNNDYLNSLNEFIDIGLKRSSKYVATVRWNIGGSNFTSAYINYQNERGTVGGAKNPSVYVWDGKIGLMYASDYGYSANGYDETYESSDEIIECNKSQLLYYNANGCANKSWIHNRNQQWTMTSNVEKFRNVFYIYIGGNLIMNYYVNSTAISARPTLYLSPNIKLTGTGEQGANAFRIIN